MLGYVVMCVPFFVSCGTLFVEDCALAICNNVWQ